MPPWNPKPAHNLHTVKVTNGLCLILAYYDYSDDLKKEVRAKNKELNKEGTIEPIPGVKKNVEMLRWTFESFNFKVLQCKLNATKVETEVFLNSCLDEIKINNDYDCLAVCISTHGDDGYFFCYDECVSTRPLFDAFQAPFSKKPRLFFIDTCQGEKIDFKSPFMSAITKHSHSFSIPSYSDYLFAYPSFQGFVSNIHNTTGSMFAEELCNVLDSKYRELDLVQMLVLVSQNVAFRCEQTKETAQLSGYSLQMPYFKSTLRCLVRLSRTKQNSEFTQLNEAIEFMDTSSGCTQLFVSSASSSTPLSASSVPDENQSEATGFRDPVVLKAMSAYMQNGQWNASDLNDSNVPLLLKVSYQYKKDDLKKLCEDYLCKKLNAETATNLWQLADDCKADNLKNEIMKFILGNQKQILIRKDYKRLSSSRKHFIAEFYKAKKVQRSSQSEAVISTTS